MTSIILKVDEGVRSLYSSLMIRSSSFNTRSLRKLDVKMSGEEIEVYGTSRNVYQTKLAQLPKSPFQKPFSPVQTL